MKVVDLIGQLFNEQNTIMRSHNTDILQMPVVAVVRTPSNTVHHLQVTGWRLGRESIELIIEQGDINGTSEEGTIPIPASEVEVFFDRINADRPDRQGRRGDAQGPADDDYYSPGPSPAK